MLEVMATAALALACLYAVVTFANLAIFRAPAAPARGSQPIAVSALVPARDEEENIGAAIDAILASTGVELELVVLDDDSSDRTADIVAERAARDPRVRLIRGEALPDGWAGKQYACWQLAQAATHPRLAFIDADVRIGPEALVRLAAALDRRRLDLVSGFPRQITVTLGEKLVIPQILVLLLGYLPFPMARIFRSRGFAAGCGQLMLVRADAYARSGGHSGIRDVMHDGIKLPRLIRASGGRTDIVDTTDLATCRMYRTWPTLWEGFSKNATEGMATPVALPIWTVLLGGGHILPYLVAAAALIAGNAAAAMTALWALTLVLVARVAVALVARQSPLSVLLHPVGMTIVLAIQWTALVNARRGAQRSWRGRTYDTS